MELIGGPEQRVIEVVPYDAEWPRRYSLEHARIEAVLGDLPHVVEHVGSTAVPGLDAKPIVDMLVCVPDVEDETSYLPALEGAGYRLRVRERGHRMVRTPELDVQVHIAEIGSDWQRRHQLFRDWLRTSGQDRALYAATKRKLAAREWATMNDYAAAKTSVIVAITERAEEWATTTGWTAQTQMENGQAG